MMANNNRNEYNEIIYSEIIKSFEKIIELMDFLTAPALMDLCKIWKAEKGAKKLIQLAI
jgi:hypothetical protein